MNAKHKFNKVFDRAGRRIRSLWQRNGNFYGQLNVPDRQGGTRQKMLPLPECQSVAQATNKLLSLKEEIKTGRYQSASISPTVKDYADYYLTHKKSAVATKRRETYSLRAWTKYLGNMPLIDVTPSQVLQRQTQEREQGNTEGTIGLNLATLKNLFNFAIKENKIKESPIKHLHREKYHAQEKVLLTDEQIAKIILTSLIHCGWVGTQFANYLVLLMYSGLREQEALQLKWTDIDFDEKKGCIHVSGALTKSKKSRDIQLGRNLRNQLLCMFHNRVNDSLIFPLHKDATRRVAHFSGTVEKVTLLSGIHFGEHHFRHYFASMCVMDNIDFMTIASWLGHSDGGILVGRVYGHLNQEHKNQMAAQLTF